MWLDSIEKKVSMQVGETGTYFIFLFKSASKKIRELISLSEIERRIEARSAR
ncbi:hypothetical protein HanIR_Chr16g0832201 [Helianthus annuus]|nr:hypothetical protein HanIR_Chr16g0832201 [Helianthus annuus]